MLTPSHPLAPQPNSNPPATEAPPAASQPGASPPLSASPASGPDLASAGGSRSREVFIQGMTKQGKVFRPSDWAERLAGAMSCFRPGGGGHGAHIGYSPYCVPTTIGNVKCVVVNEALRDIEPMAWDFVMNFAKDNDLHVADACLLPPAANGKA